MHKETKYIFLYHKVYFTKQKLSFSYRVESKALSFILIHQSQNYQLRGVQDNNDTLSRAHPGHLRDHNKIEDSQNSFSGVGSHDYLVHMPRGFVTSVFL